MANEVNKKYQIDTEENRGNFLISTFCNHTIFGDDVVFRYIICINYADNILFMHHIYNGELPIV